MATQLRDRQQAGREADQSITDPHEELRALQEALHGRPRVVDDDPHYPAVRRAQEADGLRNEALGTLGVAFITDAGSSDAFSTLARYESNIERALFRALQELQHLQSVRLDNSQDADVAPPAALSGSTE